MRDNPYWVYKQPRCPLNAKKRARRAMALAMGIKGAVPCEPLSTGQFDHCEKVCGRASWERFWRETMDVAARDLAKEVDRLMLEEMKRE